MKSDINRKVMKIRETEFQRDIYKHTSIRVQRNTKEIYHEINAIGIS